MRKFQCECGAAVFFHSEYCMACGATLGFDPASMSMVTLQLENGTWRARDGKHYKQCDNHVQFGVCNWILEAGDEQQLCWGCRFNRTVPNQSLPDNQQRWSRLEEGKKRLLYTLRQLELPIASGWEESDTGLLFDFVEDDRSIEHYPETFVQTGYLSGVITINSLEADDAAREGQRLQMNEDYRTILGHLRHESGHYYWHRLQPDAAMRDDFAAIFGDETQDYRGALDRYYADGPKENWWERHISAYASAHPSEDFAETWGHYLHIYDAIDTAAAHQLIDTPPDALDTKERISIWRDLSVTLNELNRSVGKRDAYPFVLHTEVERKLEFVDRVIREMRTRNPETAIH